MVAPNLEQLEQRLARVEQELSRLRLSRAEKDKRPWWEQIAGDYAHDEAFEEIIRLGAEWRRQQREP